MARLKRFIWPQQLIWRYVLGAVLALFLYLLSFGLIADHLDGSLYLALTGTGPIVRPPPRFNIYLSSNNAMNQTGEIFYYPLIQIGVRARWWNFIDDTSDFSGYKKRSCLLFRVIWPR